MRIFPGGLWLKLNIFLKVLVTVRPKIGGRESNGSVALIFEVFLKFIVMVEI